MKKTILTAIVLVLLSFSAKAQYFGIKGGLNFSNLNVDNVSDKNMRSGYHFGAYANLPITQGFSIQPEVLYSTKGNKANYKFGPISEDVTTKLNYIDVPILAVIRLGDMAQLEVGPYFGLLVNSKLKYEGAFEGSDDLDNDAFKTLDYGIAAGFAVNLSFLQIGARYNYGLQEIQDSNSAKLIYGAAKNSYIQLFAALRFGEY